MKHFCQNPHVDLKSQLTPKSTKISNPVSDIVDSFYICKTGFHLKENHVMPQPSKNPYLVETKTNGQILKFSKIDADNEAS